MKPDKNITSCELLVMLSRFYTLTDIQKEQIKAEYKSIVEKNVPTELSWANESIEACLAAGIITESELNVIQLNSEIEKQQLAVFLVRAMQLSHAAETLSDKELTYDDDAQISESSRGSIAELVALEIVKGDSKNNIAPKTKVNRAVVAAMISRSIKYLEKNKIKLSIVAYEGLSKENGVLVSSSNNKFKLRGFDGLVREYSIPTEADVFVGGEEKTLSAAYEGKYADLILKNGILNRLNVEKDSSVTWNQGTVDSVNASNSSIYLKDINTGKSTYYSIPSKASITQEEKNISLSSLSSRNFVSIKSKNNKVEELYSMPSNFELSGTISEIAYGDSVSMKISDEKGMNYCFSLDISDLPTIKRGDIDISVDRLKVGNIVTVTIKNCEITSIVAKGSENKLTGRLTSVTTTANGTIWNVAANDGTNKSLMLDEGVTVYSGKTAILLSDVRIGDEVSMVIYGDIVTEIYLQSVVSSSNKVMGRVLTTERYKITILTSAEKLVYVDTSSASVVSSTGKNLSISSIEKNTVIVSYGNYKNSSDFVARLVVVE